MPSNGKVVVGHPTLRLGEKEIVYIYTVRNVDRAAEPIQAILNTLVISLGCDGLQCLPEFWHFWFRLIFGAPFARGFNTVSSPIKMRLMNVRS